MPRQDRLPSRFAAWAWGEVTVLRVSLVITYLLHVYFATICFIAGVPAFNLTTFPGYTSVWAAFMGSAALLAAVGSLAERWERIEKWASLAVSATMIGYVGTVNVLGFHSGDVNRQAVAAALLIVLVLPIGRFVYLAAQTGKKRRGGA